MPFQHNAYDLTNEIQGFLFVDAVEPRSVH